ncbi:leucyl aminopeptidase family protein [Altererythrobacter sp. GH1-8]|uniref:leucyl aminopeptidase family protein n=1 Tax=Altererythrobacter sp. GH1-8 TaxID=3349333 RepID=UPI00374CA6B0
MTFRSIARLALPITAIALATSVTPVSAQQVFGSGVAPSTVANSEERPIRFETSAPADAALVVIMANAQLPSGIELPDDASAWIEAEQFEGKDGQSLDIPTGPGNPRITLIGVTPKDQAAINWREVGGSVVQKMKSVKAPIAILGVDDAAAMADIGFGATLGQYRFDRYDSDRKAPPVDPVTIVGAGASQADVLFSSRHVHLAEGVRLARDLVNEPANVIYPESFVARVREELRGVDNVTIEVLEPADMRRLNMGAIVGVGQGSPRESRLMVVTYRGAGGPPLALMGKGITFDTGGISLKPNSGMWEMKGDMSGAAAVSGAILSLAKSEAPVHVVAVAALAENMPGDNAQRPGDIVRTYSGKTIEILSTDAEGRLVLSDAIEYTVDRKKPWGVIDIATLTGGAVSALGDEYAALFARKDDYAEAALAAAERTTESLWRLPLHPAYRDAVRTSDIADVRNSGISPSASSGAHFIEFFVPEDMPWIHIDMAPVDRTTKARPLIPVGARGFGVMLLDDLARNWRPQPDN